MSMMKHFYTCKGCSTFLQDYTEEELKAKFLPDGRFQYTCPICGTENTTEYREKELED